MLISVNFSWHDQHYVTRLLSGSWELLLISAVLLLELKVKLLNLHVNKILKIYIILTLIQTFSYVDIKPAKRLQCSSASSLNDVIMQCRYVSIPYRRAPLNTRSTVSYKQTYTLVLPNNEFYETIMTEEREKVYSP